MFYDKCVLLRRYIKHWTVVCQSITWKQYIVESLLDNSGKPADSVLFIDCSCHWPVAVNELSFSQCTWTHWVILFPQDWMCQILIFLRHKGIIFLLCFMLFYGPQPWQPFGLLACGLWPFAKYCLQDSQETRPWKWKIHRTGNSTFLLPATCKLSYEVLQ